MPPQQDWFAQNAPAATEGDWFAQNAEQAPQPAQTDVNPLNPKQFVGGLLSNAASDVGNIATGLVKLANPRNWDDIYRAAQAEKREWESTPFGPPTRTQSIAEGLKPVGEFVYKNPVSAALSVLPMGASARVNLAPVGQGIQRAGVRTMRGALKPRDTELNKMAGAGQLGTDEMSRRVATIALERNINPMTARGGQAIQQGIEKADTARDALIANAPQVPIAGSGQAQQVALRPVAQKYAAQSNPASDIGAIRTLSTGMRRNPKLSQRGPGRTRTMKDLTPEEMRAVNAGDNAALRDKMGKVGSAETDALKAVTGSRRDLLEQAVPGTRELGQEMRNLIDLRKVAIASRKRAEGRDVLGLTDMVALGTRPEALLLTTAMRPAAQAELARRVYNLGGRVPGPVNVNLEALRVAALLQQLEAEQAKD